MQSMISKKTEKVLNQPIRQNWVTSLWNQPIVQVLALFSLILGLLAGIENRVKKFFKKALREKSTQPPKPVFINADTLVCYERLQGVFVDNEIPMESLKGISSPKKRPT